MAVFELIDYLKLISRKILVAEKLAKNDYK